MSGPVLIWGAGAIGGVIGGCLARARQPVHMVDTVIEHVSAMRRGLRIEGPVEAFVQALPASTPGELQGRFDRIILAVKAHHTGAALDMLLPHLAPDGYVVSAQNGLNERLIADRIGPTRTVGCFVNFGADWLGPGRILYGNRAAVAVGEMDGRITDRARDILALLRMVEPEAVLTDNIQGYLWGKMGYGALLYATALTPLSMADAMALPAHRRAYEALGHEVMRLADAEGVEPLGFNGFDPQAFLAADPARMAASLSGMVVHNRKSAKTHSGIWRDLAIRKRKTEADAHLGVMTAIAARHGLAVPVMARLLGLIHDIEQGRRAQSADLPDRLVAACA
ncbi:ketopantoate reductase family protein [Paracoccus sp. (in: a-proteobacteria)]|uniref:ketopantoate reductase family protein n=1 Tax=Paracoccus sp. TaxID=267 RepID=UPI003A8865E5